jgi:hypothetical protein
MREIARPLRHAYVAAAFKPASSILNCGLAANEKSAALKGAAT